MGAARTDEVREMVLFRMKSGERPGSHRKKGSTESRRLIYVPCTSVPGKVYSHTAGFSLISRLASFHDREGSNPRWDKKFSWQVENETLVWSAMTHGTWGLLLFLLLLTELEPDRRTLLEGVLRRPDKGGRGKNKKEINPVPALEPAASPSPERAKRVTPSAIEKSARGMRTDLCHFSTPPPPHPLFLHKKLINACPSDRFW